MQTTERETEFKQLVKEHELLIYKVCAMYTATSHDRKDLFQDIVLQLWISFRNFRGESKLSTWIYRVAINTAITGKQRSRPVAKLHESFTDSLPSDSTFESNLIEEQSRELYMAIEKLNEIEKAIVMLYIEENSYEEMREVLGISEGTLRVRMNRIKEKLRELTKSI